MGEEKVILNKTVFDTAKDGGRHNGLFRRNKEARRSEIEKSIRSLTAQIIQHEEKVKNPRFFVRDDTSDTEIDRLVNGYWPKEILNFRQQIEVLQGILNEREEQ